jgi:alpha-glucosidase
MNNLFRPRWLLLLSTCLALSALAGETPVKLSPSPEIATSPNGKVRATFALQKGSPVYTVDFLGARVIEPSALGLELADPFTDGFKIEKTVRGSKRSAWKPQYGERAVIPENYRDFTVDLRELGPRARRLRLEFRAYDEGVAFRYVIPKQTGAETWRARQERSEFRLASGSRAFPIYGGEETFSPDSVALAEVKKGAHTPLTLQLPKGFASLYEAYVENYPRLLLDPLPGGGFTTRLRGEVAAATPFKSPWRVILLGETEGRLIENEYLGLNLNPPCAIQDTAWIAAGKTISNEGSVPLDTTALKKVVDFASTNGFKYLQLDWGWYGTEWAWSDQERATFRKTMPELADKTDWVPNTEANPLTVAKGPVPYRPDWKSVTQVSLDMPELIRHARERGMGVCLYVEAGRTLRAQNLEALFTQYQKWGVAGLKPGFVRYGSQENTEWIRQLVKTAAQHQLWLCIHDEHVPDGMERTYPNLLICEGGGGQEGGHPVSHDVMLPFTRCLAGPFDYTPQIYNPGRSHAHMLALLVAYYGPAQTVRGGYPAWNGVTGPGKGGEELEFLRRVPATWDSTRVLDAKIGQHLVVARRRDKTWFLGGLTGMQARTLSIPLNFLEPKRAYQATLFLDNSAAATDGWCPTRKETRAVKSADTLELPMAAGGGAVAVLDPL